VVTTWHEDCGAPVELGAGRVLDPDGGTHLCRDYVSWYGPADQRDPFVVDVAVGWAPRVRLDLAA